MLLLLDYIYKHRSVKRFSTMPRKKPDDALVTHDLARFFDRMAAHFPGHVMQRVLEPDGRVHYSYVSPGLSALGLDPARLRAVDRLVQVESHGDNLDDLVTFSSMTVEEAHESAKALMELVEKLDADHYNRLCRQCR